MPGWPGCCRRVDDEAVLGAECLHRCIEGRAAAPSPFMQHRQRRQPPGERRSTGLRYFGRGLRGSRRCIGYSPGHAWAPAARSLNVKEQDTTLVLAMTIVPTNVGKRQCDRGRCATDGRDHDRVHNAPTSRIRLAGSRNAQNSRSARVMRAWWASVGCTRSTVTSTRVLVSTVTQSDGSRLSEAPVRSGTAAMCPRSPAQRSLAVVRCLLRTFELVSTGPSAV